MLRTCRSGNMFCPLCLKTMLLGGALGDFIQIGLAFYLCKQAVFWNHWSDECKKCSVEHLFILSLTHYDSWSSDPRYIRKYFVSFAGYYHIFVIKNLKDIYILFSSQHILNFLVKMGCFISHALLEKRLWFICKLWLESIVRMAWKLKLHCIPSFHNSLLFSLLRSGSPCSV